jgi:hypothetical protein
MIAGMVMLAWKLDRYTSYSGSGHFGREAVEHYRYSQRQVKIMKKWTEGWVTFKNRDIQHQVY